MIRKYGRFEMKHEAVKSSRSQAFATSAPYCGENPSLRAGVSAISRDADSTNLLSLRPRRQAEAPGLSSTISYVDFENLRFLLNRRKLTSMKVSEKADRKARDAAKAASRKADAERLANGEDPEVLQRENSIFPKDFLKNGRIQNLSDAVGR